MKKNDNYSSVQCSKQRCKNQRMALTNRIESYSSRYRVVQKNQIVCERHITSYSQPCSGLVSEDVHQVQ